MNRISRTMIVIAAATATAAPAQIASYERNNPPPVKGDADKIVCEKEERIGTRLGAKKVCLTVSEWQQRGRVHREQTERLQMGVCVPGELSCNDATGEPY